MPRIRLALALSSLCAVLSAQTEDAPQSGDKSPMEKMFAQFQPKTGEVALRNVAKLSLPEGWVFLAEESGRKFLTQLHNHPGPETIGVAIPADYKESHAFAVYSYADEGHVEDGEAVDYDALLKDMRESTHAESEDRKAHGEQGVELLGWAEAPHYDKAQHKLYWAEKLQFEGESSPTLNYNVRILGRSGHLVVNGVGDIEQLALVAEQNKQLLTATEFVDGQRYENFDPAYDKLAAVGIGGLIAGKLAAKVGIFAWMLLKLKVLWKFVVIGVIAVAGAIGKLFGGKKREPRQRKPSAGAAAG